MKTNGIEGTIEETSIWCSIYADLVNCIENTKLSAVVIECSLLFIEKQLKKLKFPFDKKGNFFIVYLTENKLNLFE